MVDCDTIGIMESLVKIAAKHPKSDKAVSGYCPIYEDLFRDIRLGKFNILEIGVKKGGSLRMWKEYFPNAQIYGIDINGRAKRYEEDRIQTEIIDQSDKVALELFAKDKKFQLIIDDGSHKSSHQITSFETLWPYISPKGYYIIEDVETSYWVNSPRGYVDQSPTCVDYFKNMIFEINNNGIPNLSPHRYSYYRKTVQTLTFSSGLIILRKRRL